jgi:hypothetical protein
MLHKGECTYPSTYIVCCVAWWGTLTECSVALFRGSVVSLHLRVGVLSHGGEQIKGLFNRYFAHLLRIREADIV